MQAIGRFGKAAKILALLLALVFGLGAPVTLLAQANPQSNQQGNPQVGVVTAVQGQATVARDGQAPAQLALNDPVFRLDTLATAAGAMLEVELNDGSTFTLDEASSVRVAEYEVGSSPKGLLELAFGRLRSLVATTFSSRRDSFKVRTLEGVIGVQGTEFDVIAMADETEVFVWVGEVTVAHVDPQFPDVQTVRGGFTVRFRIDEPVPEPVPIQQIPERDLPPPLGSLDAYLPPLIAGTRVPWTAECEIPSRPKPSVAMEPMTVGTEDDVGKEGFAEKQAKNVIGGVLGSILGSSSSSKSKGPKTRRDPTRKLDFLELSDPALETELGVRGEWTEDGLLVSTRIEESPDKGTFQAVFLEDCSGRRLYPERIEIYKLWAKATLSVSWTRTTYVNGSVIDQQSGGWSQTWSSDLGRWGRRGEAGSSGPMPIWAQAGYSRAHAGVQHIGAFFRIAPEQLQHMGQLAFIAHVTRPEQDPVVTVPFGVLVGSGGEEVPAFSPMPR